MKIVLDTNAYSDWVRNGRWHEVITTASEVMIPSIVLGELRYGFRGSKLHDKNEKTLVRFLKYPAVNVLEVGEATSKVYAHLKHFLRSAGTPIPENDVWIAALAVELSASVVTADSHFDFLPQVTRVFE